MADFDDSADPDLGAACNRLAAFTLPIEVGAVIDEASGLTEKDLVKILRALHRSRKSVWIEEITMEEMGKRYGAGSAHYAANIAEWSDEQLLRAYQGTSGTPGDPQADALCAEIRRRELNV